MSDTKFITYRTVFVPSKELSKQAIDLANNISKQGDVFFKVDDKRYFTHLTVYKSEFPVGNSKKVHEVLRGFSSKQKPFRLKFKKFFAEWGWLGLDFIRNGGVYSAHKKIVDLLNPLRGGHITEKYLREIKEGKYSRPQRENIMQFGYPLVMGEYHPHLTLVQFRTESVARVVKNLYNGKKISIGESEVKKIALVESGEHGTVTRIIKEFRLRE